MQSRSNKTIPAVLDMQFQNTLQLASKKNSLLLSNRPADFSRDPEGESATMGIWLSTEVTKHTLGKR